MYSWHILLVAKQSPYLIIDQNRKAYNQGIKLHKDTNDRKSVTERVHEYNYLLPLLEPYKEALGLGIEGGGPVGEMGYKSE